MSGLDEGRERDAPGTMFANARGATRGMGFNEAGALQGVKLLGLFRRENSKLGVRFAALRGFLDRPQACSGD